MKMKNINIDVLWIYNMNLIMIYYDSLLNILNYSFSDTTFITLFSS